MQCRRLPHQSGRRTAVAYYILDRDFIRALNFAPWNQQRRMPKIPRISLEVQSLGIRADPVRRKLQPNFPAAHAAHIDHGLTGRTHNRELRPPAGPILSRERRPARIFLRQAIPARLLDQDIFPAKRENHNNRYADENRTHIASEIPMLSVFSTDWNRQRAPGIMICCSTQLSQKS